MQIRLHDFDIRLTQLRLRLPFRYGIATMTRGPMLFARLRAEVDGREVSGISSDLLPAKWFTKVPARPLEEEIEELLRVARNAFALAAGLRGSSAFAIWQQLYAAQSAWGEREKMPPLLSNFGTSLVERALIEAVGCATGRPFAAMVRENILGVDLAAIHAELHGRAPADFLPAAPLPKIIARHTVGLVDALTEAEIAGSDRLRDGLPQSLEAAVRACGLRHFKIKISGDVEKDVDRLSRIADVLRKCAPPDFAFSLDGNEQFKSFGEFRRFWDAALGAAPLKDFFPRLLFVEQPLHRDAALLPSVGAELRDWPERPPLIIDESDGAPEDLPAALRLGYAGTSHKNCKGVFKGIANRCLIAHRHREEPERQLLMSGEDLCNVGPVALLQDLAVMAALGISSVERNGHHYHAGLSQFPPRVQQQVLEHHSDLYERRAQGWPALRIRGGEVDLGSVNRAPLGVGFAVEVEQFASGLSDPASGSSS